MQKKDEPIENSPKTNRDEPTDIRSSLEKLSCNKFYFSRAEPTFPCFFTDNDLFNLSLSSRILYSAAQPELTRSAPQKLLTYVILGEQDKANAMIKANPKWLLIQSKAVDYSGRTIIATPFQAAIGAGH